MMVSLNNIEILQAPWARGPVLVLEHDVDASKDLNLTQADTPEVTIVEINADWPGVEGEGRATQSELPTLYAWPVARDS